MKTLFIEARRKFKEIDFTHLNELPGKKVSLSATVQYLDLLQKIKSHLESIGKEVIIKKGASHEGHVLGCNSSAFDKTANTLLLITDGKFHAINNAIQLNREIYIFNTKSLEKITRDEIDKYNKKLKAKKSKFLLSDNIGILVSTKHRQHNKSVSQIKKGIEKLGKKAYIFESNNINTKEFENFPTIDIWVNTACVGLTLDHKDIINIGDVLDFI